MPLILLLTGPAFAARVYWTTPPTAADLAATERALPGASAATFAELGGLAPLAEVEGGALGALRSELDATRPLVDQFDGELEIMARLAKATADVGLLRTEADRKLLFDALAFEGYAVHRYFQDRLGTEAAAAAFRVGTGSAAQVRPWLDAAALLDAPPLSPELVPDQAERLAYDDVQAYTRVMPSVTFTVGALAAGAEVYVDGTRVETAGARVLAVPGRHYVHVQVGDTVLFHAARPFDAGTTFAVQAPYGPTEQAELTELVGRGTDGWPVPGAVRAVALAVGEPVYVGVSAGGSKDPFLVRLDSPTATRVAIPKGERARSSAAPADAGVFGRVAAGAGWASTGDWFLQNVADGAPHDASTVNGAAPAVSGLVGYRRGLFVVGAGLDALLTTGAFHSLPSGDGDLRVWTYPHLAVGIPWVQATVGFQAPWYVGLGGQAEVPVWGPLAVFAKGTVGVPVPISRTEGPTFEPLPAYDAWGGVAVRFGP